jgi:hypothetical protein
MLPSDFPFDVKIYTGTRFCSLDRPFIDGYVTALPSQVRVTTQHPIETTLIDEGGIPKVTLESI